MARLRLRLNVTVLYLRLLEMMHGHVTVQHCNDTRSTVRHFVDLSVTLAAASDSFIIRL